MKTPDEMLLEQMELGPMENFLYFIGDAQSKDIAVVDPAWDVPELCRRIDKNGYTVKSVFLTHGHMDHVNGLDEFLKEHDVPAYMSKHEADFYKPDHKNLVEVDDQEKLKIGGIEFTCLHTPGHSPGCQCFLYKNVLIAGDTVFIDGCGRCDLPGSDPEAMYNSLYHVVSKLPNETVIYPGHNYGPAPSATLKDQKHSNPYLTCDSREDFLQRRMGITL